MKISDCKLFDVIELASVHGTSIGPFVFVRVGPHTTFDGVSEYVLLCQEDGEEMRVFSGRECEKIGRMEFVKE